MFLAKNLPDQEGTPTGVYGLTKLDVEFEEEYGEIWHLKINYTIIYKMQRITT